VATSVLVRVGVETHVLAMLESGFYLVSTRFQAKKLGKRKSRKSGAFEKSPPAGGGSGKSEREAGAFRDPLMVGRNRQKEEMNTYVRT
jgi:hypothetical protein